MVALAGVNIGGTIYFSMQNNMRMILLDSNKKI